MDIIQIIKDNLPEGTELSDKAISAIAKEIKVAQGLEFVPKESYSKKTELADKLEKELKEAQGASSDAETYKKKYEDEVIAHNATKTTHATEKDNADIDSLVAALLKKPDNKGASMNAIAIPKALKLYDRAIVERDKDGSIKNTDKVLESFKAEWGDFFGEVKQEGADVGTPPPTPKGDPDPFLDGFNQK